MNIIKNYFRCRGTKISPLASFTDAVIGAGEVVTKDIGQYEIWAGNPARFIRKRFDDDIIEKLLASEWWNWSDEELYLYGKTFVNVEEFLTFIGKCEKGVTK